MTRSTAQSPLRRDAHRKVGSVARQGRGPDRRLVVRAGHLALRKVALLWLALTAGATALIVEGVRVLRGGAALSRITVAPRPTRVIFRTVLACGAAAVSTQTWPPTVCASVSVALGLVGIVQVATA